MQTWSFHSLGCELLFLILAIVRGLTSVLTSLAAPFPSFISGFTATLEDSYHKRSWLQRRMKLHTGPGTVSVIPRETQQQRPKCLRVVKTVQKQNSQRLSKAWCHQSYPGRTSTGFLHHQTMKTEQALHAYQMLFPDEDEAWWQGRKRIFHLWFTPYTYYEEVFVLIF